MAFLVDVEELKPGLIIFRRGDVGHRNWYCRIKVPDDKTKPDSKRYRDRYKTVSLKTPDIGAARAKAWEAELDVLYRVKYNVPVFNKSFSEVAEEYVAHLQVKANNGKITQRRVAVVASIIRAQLNPYVGSIQIDDIGEERWEGYPDWRRANGVGRYGRVSDATISLELSVFRSVMHFAIRRKYRAPTNTFEERIELDKVRRDEFTPEEYRKLHTFARGWVERASDEARRWYRAMAYNFVLIMCNTGMRPSEARNLRWRDVEARQDREGRRFVVLQVRGKKKERQLVAAANVGDYLERIRAMSRFTEPHDPVFSVRELTPTGLRALADESDKNGGNVPAASYASTNWKSANTLYKAMIRDLLEESGLLVGQNGKDRSTYCFRHTYATFRLTEGVEGLFLAHQMGTDIKMIQQHYGHINSVKNAALILRGLPGWEAAATAAPAAVSEPNPFATKAAQEAAAELPRRPRYRRRPGAPKQPAG